MDRNQKSVYLVQTSNQHIQVDSNLHNLCKIRNVTCKKFQVNTYM